LGMFIKGKNPHVLDTY